MTNRRDWAPITDEELLAEAPSNNEPPPWESDEEVASEAAPPIAEESPPPPVISPAAPAAVPPVGPIPGEDWDLFNRLLRKDHSMSVDFAASCAGIRIYDALTALEARNPYFYQVVVLRGPQGGYLPTSRRPSGRVKAKVGRTLHEEGRVTATPAQRNYRNGERAERKSKGERKPPPGRPSVEDARRRFLAMLGEREETDRIDGQESEVQRKARRSAARRAKKGMRRRAVRKGMKKQQET